MTLRRLSSQIVEAGRSINIALLRVFLRLVPSENHRVFAVALIAGGLCGLAAVLFHLSIIGTENRLIERAMHAHGHTWIWWTIGGMLGGAFGYLDKVAFNHVDHQIGPFALVG